MPLSERITLMLATALGAGCAAPPVPVSIDASGPRAARVTIRPIGGQTADVPTGCETPCRFEFQPDETYEIELRAPGWQRARLAVEYQVMFQHQLSSDEDEPRLVIPMLPEPTLAD